MTTSRSTPHRLSDQDLEMLAVVANKRDYPKWGWNPIKTSVDFEHILTNASKVGFYIDLSFRPQGRISVKVKYPTNEFFSNAETAETYKTYVCRTILNILNDLPNKQLEAFLNE
jgi:hypothetical protein